MPNDIDPNDVEEQTPLLSEDERDKLEKALSSELEAIRSEDTWDVERGLVGDRLYRALLRRLQYSAPNPAEPPPLTTSQLQSLLDLGFNEPWILMIFAKIGLGRIAKDEPIENPELLAAQLLEQAQAGLHAGDLARHIWERQQAAADSIKVPDDFTFPGYDPAYAEVQPADYRFETARDALGWAVFALGPHTLTASGNAAEPAPFPTHGTNNYCYLMKPGADGTITVSLFADAGTGTYPGLYVIRQVARRKSNYAVHLGDVYYAGRRSEFSRNFTEPLQSVMEHSDLYVLAGNHEMLAGGWNLADFVHGKREPAAGRVAQHQEGFYFCLYDDKVQLVAIDTEWYGQDDVTDQQFEWLGKRLEDGRQSGRLTVLLTSRQPFGFGSTKLTRLGRKLKPFANEGLIHAWFWGNVHYGALFKPNPHKDIPYVGSCIGFGGYPYIRLPDEKIDTCRTEPDWVERDPRHLGIASAPQEQGNNGFCVLTIQPNGDLGLEYVDWRGQTRAKRSLVREHGRFVIAQD